MAEFSQQTDSATAAAAPLRPVDLGPSDCVIERKADGTITALIAQFSN